MSRRWNNCLPNNRNNKQPHIRKSYFPSIWKKGKDKPLLTKSHADDTTIYASCHPSDLPPPQNWRSQLCAQCPQLLVYWLSPSTHPTKTKTVVLSTSQISRVPSSRISSRSLERVNLTKLLGIHFSEHLSWEDCMSTNCQKSCHSALGILRKIKNFTRNTYLAITLAKLKLSPVRLGTGWVMNIVFKFPTLLFLCFLLLYCPNLRA